MLSSRLLGLPISETNQLIRNYIISMDRRIDRRQRKSLTRFSLISTNTYINEINVHTRIDIEVWLT
uniref:Uncharacterized protein n=1 Tax=Parascaris univalens TaxID=6257 RepID=A0A915CCX3_PARUN